MKMREMMYNRKGFMHHPDTPPEDKDFYIQQKEKARQLLQIGEHFISSGGVLSHRSLIRGREELGSRSKHLHRGVYCPSPVLDILITNSKRGRILVKPSERSHITNRYVYDTEDRLLYIDSYIDDRMISSEYLLYQNNIVYGVTVGMNGRLMSVTEEEYAGGKLQSYIWAFYSGEELNLNCNQMDCEKYYYDDKGLLDWDYYQIYFSWEKEAPSGFIKHKRYRFTREEGYLKSFTLVNNDGSLIEDSSVNEIKLKRKA